VHIIFKSKKIVVSIELFAFSSQILLVSVVTESSENDRPLFNFINFKSVIILT